MTTVIMILMVMATMIMIVTAMIRPIAMVNGHCGQTFSFSGALALAGSGDQRCEGDYDINGDDDYDGDCDGDDQTHWSMAIAGGVDQRWECEIDAEVVECDTVP